jgi:small redox-active disulfide protein 2
MARKTILVLGTGCPKCEKLAETARAAADGLGIEYDLEKVTDIGRIAAFGVMMTPALVVDGEVKAAGKVPTADEIQTMLQA